MGSYTSKIGGYGATAGTLVFANSAPYDQWVRANSTLAAYWPLYDQVAVATAEIDVSAGGRNATVNGSPTQTSTAYVGESAINFSASGMYLKSTGTALQIATGSVEFWCKIASNPATGTNKALLFGLVESSSKWDKAIYLNAAGSLVVACQTAAGVASTLVTSANFPLGRWNHVLFSHDGTFGKLYVNGVLADSQVVLTGHSDFSGANVFIAGTGSTFGFIDCPGNYNHVAAYTSALTATDALSHYNIGQGYLLTSGARVSTVSLDVLRDATARKARVTNVAADVLRDASARKARVSHFAVEVLRSYARGAFETDHVTISGVATSTVIRNYSVSATSHVTISGTAPASRDVFGDCSDTILISPVAAQNREIVVSSTDAVTLSVVAAEDYIADHTPVDYFCDATDTVNLTAEALEMADFPESSTDGVTVSDSASALVGHTYSASASDNFDLSDQSIEGFLGRGTGRVTVTGIAQGRVVHNYRKSASSSFLVQGNQAKAKINPIRVSAQSGIRVLGNAADANQTNFAVDAAELFALSDEADADIFRLLSGVASSRVNVTGRGSEVADLLRGANTGVHITDQEGGGRAIRVSAVTGLGLISGGLPKGAFHADAASGIFSVADESFSGIGSRNARTGISLAASADARISIGPGPGTVLISDTSGDFPMSFAETPSGLILIADGIDPMIRWDGLAAVATPAGIRPPTSPIALGGMDVGTISGRRVAYCRYIDEFGNRSCLSPVSNEANFGRDALIDDIAVDATTHAVTVRSDAHGLATGEAVVIGGVEGMDNINGTRVITVLDENRFSLNGVVSGGQYRGGAYWVWGVATVVYQNVPVPTDPKVVRRQILRNLDGDASTFYVDIDTTDLNSTVLASMNDDEALVSGEPVPLFFDDDLPAANRYGVPPSHKAVVASHLGRIFATGDVTYREGSCSVTYGSLEIRGVGTGWRRTFIGRLIYPAGATRAYEIAGVDEAAQVITLSSAYADPTTLFATYAIRSAPGERKLVYYSEPSLPEAWPPWNAIAVPEDSDEIVGMMVKGSFLYVVERRHIYRFTFQTDPATDGFLFLSTMRGCVNNRCHVQVEDTTYMLDETGIHAFDGGQSSTPLSAPIQNLFQLDGTGGLQVDWAADQTLWHAAHDPVRDTIRWFVHFVGDADPEHALCYDYRLQRWWIEKYPEPITSSTVGTIGYRRSLVGTTGRRVLCLSEGSLDGVSPQAGLRGTSTGGDETTLTDAAGLFPADLAGVPVAITDGTLKGQVRIIAESTATDLTVVEPWDGTPDSTTQYQIGGVPWSWRSGWFRHAEDDGDNPRDVEVVFQPLASPGTLDLSLYYDHSETPRVWSYTRTQDGAGTEDGSPYVSMDLATPTGYVQHRLTGHSERYALGDRYVQVGLSGVQAADVVRVFQVGVSGAKGEE